MHSIDLTLMYSLLSRIDGGLEPLKSNFEKHVKQVGLDEILKEAKEASEVLCELYASVEMYLQTTRNHKFLSAFCCASTESTQT